MAAIMEDSPLTGGEQRHVPENPDHLARHGHDLGLVARDQSKLAAPAGRLPIGTGVAVKVLRADLTADVDIVRVADRLGEAS